MRFWKMNGAGNDFIVLSNWTQELSEERLAEVARIVCRRRQSIGADGLMVVEPAQGAADFRMRFFNADGSVGEMCGNGARCICRYGYENGLAEETMCVETTAGPVYGSRLNRSLYRVQLNPPTKIDLNRSFRVDGQVYGGAYIELGSPPLPHAVIPLEHLQERDTERLRELGRRLRWHESFPKGANVNFCERVGNDHIRIRTFERGVEDLTLACGTGSASTALALHRMGLVGAERVRLETDGGDLWVDVAEQADGTTFLYLTGPTCVAAKGEITDDALLELLSRP